MAIQRSDTAGTLHRPQERPLLRHFKTWWMLPIHFILCLALALVMIVNVDGYLALNGNQPRKQNGKYTLRASDVITIISAAIVVIKVSIASYTASCIWRCVFVCLEKTGLTFSQLSNLMTYRIFIPDLKGRGTPVGWMVATIMILLLPQAFIPPLLTGALGWEAAYEDVGNVTISAGAPNAQIRLWGWYQLQPGNRKSAVRAAAGLASQAWSNSVSGRSANKCRAVLNSDDMPLNSTVHNVTMPCLVFHEFIWPTKEADEELVNLVSGNGSSVLSMSDDSPMAYPDNIGVATVIDRSLAYLKRPAVKSLAGNFLWNIGAGNPYPPKPYRFRGRLTAVVQVAKNYIYEPKFVTYFGKDGTNPKNQFKESKGSGAIFTYANVSFTAGVANPDTSTYLTNQVVEGNFDPTMKDIREAPWVHEALYLLPDVMSLVACMNTTQLDTWDNLHDYTENLIRYSYAGAYTMLSRTFDEGMRKETLHATKRAPRLQAVVSKGRVGAWLALSLLLTLTAIPMLYLQSQCERATVADGLAAALLTDTGRVLDGREHLTNLSFLTGNEMDMKLKLQREGGDGRYVLTGGSDLPADSVPQEHVNHEEKV